MATTPTTVVTSVATNAASPLRRARRVRQISDAAEDQDREARLDEEVPEVEGQLQQRLPAVQDERGTGADELREYQRLRIAEEQPEHERNLAQRHRVRVAPELDVHDEDLGEAEDDRQRPPRDVERGVRRARAYARPRSTRPGPPRSARRSTATRAPYRSLVILHERPRVPRPRVARPRVARPRVARPRVARPRVARPRVARPVRTLRPHAGPDQESPDQPSPAQVLPFHVPPDQLDWAELSCAHRGPSHAAPKMSCSPVRACRRGRRATIRVPPRSIPTRLVESPARSGRRARPAVLAADASRRLISPAPWRVGCSLGSGRAVDVSNVFTWSGVSSGRCCSRSGGAGDHRGRGRRAAPAEEPRADAASGIVLVDVRPRVAQADDRSAGRDDVGVADAVAAARPCREPSRPSPTTSRSCRPRQR